MVNPLHPLAPLAGWLFNEGKGSQVWDIGGHGNHGTLTNMAPASDWVGGRNGWALDFDGVNDRVDVTQNIGDGNVLSISFWVNPQVITAPSDRAPIVSRWKNDTNDRGFQIRQDEQGGNNNDFRFSVSHDGTNFDEVGVASFYTLNQWQHVVVVYDTGAVNIYKDGTLHTSDTLTSTTIYNSNTNLAFGRAMNGGAWNYFNGLIDHVLIYNRALSAGEVAWLYHDPFCFMAQPSAVMKWVAAAGLSIPVAMRYYRNRRAA